MDRLSLVILVLAAGAGCDSNRSTAPAASRVDAVPVGRAQRVTPLSEFCDVDHAESLAPAFAFPELAEPAQLKNGAWHWINVWATWCKPCLEEMPLLKKWNDDLRHEGRAVDLVFLSVDEDDATLAEFRKENPESPRGPRVKDPKDLAAWVTALGLDAGATIPMNIFVDKAGRVRCARTGALKSHHYDIIARLVQ